MTWADADWSRRPLGLKSHVFRHHYAGLCISRAFTGTGYVKRIQQGVLDLTTISSSHGGSNCEEYLPLLTAGTCADRSGSNLAVPRYAAFFETTYVPMEQSIVAARDWTLAFIGVAVVRSNRSNLQLRHRGSIHKQAMYTGALACTCCSAHGICNSKWHGEETYSRH